MASTNGTTTTTETPSSDSSSNPKKNKTFIIAAGLPRCATSSLRAAFEQDLNLFPCMHMKRIIPSVPLIRLTCQALALNLDEPESKSRRHQLLHRLFDEYAATCDFPGSLFIDDFIEMYNPGGVKIILNKRSSAEAWHRSITDTIARAETRSFFWLTCPLLPTSYWLSRLMQATTEMCRLRYGVSLFDIRVYERHNEWVRRIARERGLELLEWEPSMGYDELCRFIDRPVPVSPQGECKEFPHVNDTVSMKMFLRAMVVKGCMYWAAALAVPAAAYYSYLKFWRLR
ncbi:hypothetical protein VTN00DRAFT_3575 [Thermoascus crustaceus]|uniref:uncharacterized protein n=1 Tax=Thermoascus crustaceus TaxID=5088 RepID=UPI003744335A